MSNTSKFQLQGRIFLEFEIRIITGLHIGGSPGTLAIGNVDNPVIRDPLTKQPYIPGSSLRGKMRSQQEKRTGKSQNNEINRDLVRIHACENDNQYAACDVCQVYGTAVRGYTQSSRLIVRDAFLTPSSKQELEQARTDLPFTEVKWEAAIDRITSAATPRQQERVPAGARFQGSLTFNIYNELQDIKLFSLVLEALALVQEDYLGGQGSRGSGQVAFHALSLSMRLANDYPDRKQMFEAENIDLLRTQWQTLLEA